MDEIDVAVFAFDGAQSCAWSTAPASGPGGRPNSCSGAPPPSWPSACLAGHSPRIVDVAFPGGSGRWEVRRTTFRQGGRPHHLLVLADVSRPLREEERHAWQR